MGWSQAVRASEEERRPEGEDGHTVSITVDLDP